MRSQKASVDNRHAGHAGFVADGGDGGDGDGGLERGRGGGGAGSACSADTGGPVQKPPAKVRLRPALFCDFKAASAALRPRLMLVRLNARFGALKLSRDFSVPWWSSPPAALPPATLFCDFNAASAERRGSHSLHLSRNACDGDRALVGMRCCTHAHRFCRRIHCHSEHTSQPIAWANRPRAWMGTAH